MLAMIRSHIHQLRPYRRWIAVTICIVLTAIVLHSTRKIYYSSSTPSPLDNSIFRSRVLMPTITCSTHKQRKRYDPEKWLRDNSDMTHFETGDERFNDRPKAALISLVRNEELEGILQSMRQLEHHWNHRYRYPWIFFSEKEFTEEFKASHHPL